MTEAEIRETFRYHSPNPEAVALHEDIRAKMTELVVDVAGRLPHSRERSLFITLCQQAQMMANASIAIHGLPNEKPDSQTVAEHLAKIANGEVRITRE